MPAAMVYNYSWQEVRHLLRPCFQDLSRWVLCSFSPLGVQEWRQVGLRAHAEDHLAEPAGEAPGAVEGQERRLQGFKPLRMH